MAQENQQGQVTEENLVDSVVGIENSVDDVFTPGFGQTEEPVQEEAVETTPEVNYETPQDNEEVRYQYWQSEADKAKNENEQLKKTVEILQQTIQKPAESQPEEISSEPEIEPFRDAPQKPNKPVGFNRAEAIDDPNSASAQYLDSMDSYRDEMDIYNADKLEYESNLINIEREALIEEQKRQKDAFEAEQRNQEQVSNITQQLRSQYNANDDEVNDFIQKMSDPESLNIDNLWRLYQMDKGKVPEQPVAQPSPQFNQVQRAQSVPAPMGVQSSANMQQTGKSASDLIMDDLISDYESKNPWK
tara:strand:- start:1714 stop:2622 length:909 start_codon:yes stop_codon:yes gene_type:complete